ncbi:putative F420-dependent oxidoreductase [Sinobacterium caligoides]|uniref:Putative F420-dependent oxidoreductase n=1 Tax=Sinobacterium caligoides TaxID=933926 RepID=A0A3N2DPP8_9GAMM|nr:TIGR03619 family F420-dependent LLM class oxidoreductase [Sinobacterium caligoides]ROS01295.1 putative F420-dependent oxidoreductase [Sinobacterium caligoides]
MKLGFNSMNTLKDPSPFTLAKALEERDFESLWYGEHSHIPMSLRTPYPGGGTLPEPYKGMMDPYVSLMAAASVTKNLKLGTGIALLLERELFSQAKTIATLDQHSGGRVIIGTGVGWNEEEFSNCSQLPWKRRFTALKETVEAQRCLFSEPEPEYHGSLIDFDKVWFEPKPLQRGGPKTLLGVMGPVGIKHAAQWADGWMPADVALPDVVQSVQDFRHLVAEFGRDPSEVEITIVVMDNPTADKLKAYRDAGVDRALIGIGMDNWDKPEIIWPMLDEFAPLIPELSA